MLQQITSLRGIAIILIILFHLAPQYAPFGYLGVEIFLVISGYLLMRSFRKQQGYLNQTDFFKKKIARLVPPITILIILTLAAGIGVMDYVDYNIASKTATHTLLGNANGCLNDILSNYFSPAASFNPFLHMWYIAVTIHVYLLFALGCFLYRNLPRRIVVSIIWCVGIASLLWSQSYTLHIILSKLGIPLWEQSISPSYYLTFPRLWEPLAGVWLATLPEPRQRTNNQIWILLALLLCLFVLVCAFVRYSFLCPFITIVGTCLVIRYLTQGKLASWFNNPALQCIGGISFSLYLVHMPLIAFWYSWFHCAPPIMAILLIIACTFGAGYIYHHKIEKKIFSWKTTILLYLLAMSLALAGYCTNGFQEYVYKDINSINHVNTKLHNMSECKAEGIYDNFDKAAIPYLPSVEQYICTEDFQGNSDHRLIHLGKQGTPPSVLLIGDSFGAASVPGTNQIFNEMGISGVYLTSVIFPLWDIQAPNYSPGYPCGRQKIEAYIKWLRAHPEIKHIIIAMRWSHWRHAPWQDWNSHRIKNSDDEFHDRLQRFIMEMRALDRNVILIGPLLEIKEKDPHKLYRRMLRGGHPYIEKLIKESTTCSREKFEQDHKEVLRVFKRLRNQGICHILDMYEYIPVDKPFSAYEGGKILQRDDHHMSRYGSQRFYQYLKPQLTKLLLNEAPKEAPEITP